MTGKTILHYKIGELLGAGGMGEVYKAEDTRLGRTVALKFLPSSFEYDPERRARFMREARTASSLQSPNIAAIYDIGEEDDIAFIVMEYVDGELLSARVARGPVPVREAIDLTMQIADALDEARRLGVVHRDIKSSNVIVTGRGLVKVLDFGLAKVVEQKAPSEDSTTPTLALQPKSTIAGTLLGTVLYMSPEQALGRPVDHRSDLFSLGVVLYQLLTTRFPFEGASATEIIDRIVHQEPAAVARFNYDVPPDLERIVRKALEKEPDFRYQTAREIYIDLRNLCRDLRDREAAERSTSKLLASHPSHPSHPSGADLTASLGGREPHEASNGEPKLANAVAVMTFANITKEPVDDWIGSGIAETVTADMKNIRGLTVIGRERIFDAIKNLGSGDLTMSDETLAIGLGRRLGAAWIIGGGYQRIGELIRITARFIDTATGVIVKTVKIDGQMSAIFELQDKIVYELSQDLKLELGGSEIAAIEHHETRSVEAYESFSRGLINLRSGSRDALDRSIHLFERAIEHDPNYAAAWAALGAVYDLKGSFLGMPDLSAKAIEYERRAIELNPRLSHAHEWLGAAYTGLGRFDEALEAIQEALRLEPSRGSARLALARVYWVGKGMIDEGIEQLERAVALDPQLGYAHLQLGFLYAIKDNYRRAEAACQRAIVLQERYISGKVGLQIVGARTRLGYVYYREGRYDDAIREYEREHAFLLSTDHALRERTLIELDQKLGAAKLRKGLVDEAEALLERAVRAFKERCRAGSNDHFASYYIACAYGIRGDVERAVKHLEESFTTLRALNTLRARTDPDFDAVRDDDRFRRLLDPEG